VDRPASLLAQLFPYLATAISEFVGTPLMRLEDREGYPRPPVRRLTIDSLRHVRSVVSGSGPQPRRVAFAGGSMMRRAAPSATANTRPLPNAHAKA
jgi:hypothetical protein